MPVTDQSPSFAPILPDQTYRSAFMAMHQGFSLLDIQFDEGGRAYDVIIRDANPAQHRIDGLQNLIGQRLREFQSDSKLAWIERYAQVARSGKPAHFEDWSLINQRWYAVDVSPVGAPGSSLVALIYNDITDRKRSELNLAFLAEISQDLARLTDINESMNRLGGKIGAHLNLSRCLFFEIDKSADEALITHEWHLESLPDIAGAYRIEEFVSEELWQESLPGEIIVVYDTGSDPRTDAQWFATLDVGSFLAIPFVREGEWAFMLAVCHSTPYNWRQDEIELVNELTSRIQMRLERARTEEALRESERFVQSLVSSLPLVIYLFDLKTGQNRYLSPQVAELFGYTPEQMQANGAHMLTTFFHPDDQPRLTAYFTRIRNAEEDADGRSDVFHSEYRINHRERGWTWVESRDVVYARDADGKPSLLLGTAEDISARRAAAQALQESDKRLRLALEATEMGTWDWNLVTNQVFWNEQHFRLFGMEPQPQPLTPDTFMNHVHPSERERISHLLQKAIAERSVYDAEFCALLEDGSTRWMSGYGRIVEEIDGKPLRMSGVMFDVDERRRAEDALRAADQRKDEFLAMLAHELRNPMATIRNGLNILRLIGETDQLTGQTVGMMNRQVDHLVRLVDDLLDVSRISQNKIQLRRERLELGALVEGAVEAIRPQYAALGKGLHLIPATAPLFVDGDATRLVQVVTNLLTNGVRYTGQQGQVWVSVIKDAGEAFLRVADNGIGLSVDQLTAIFKLFVQADNSLARQQGGLGIGLTLVQRLVVLHGGRVEARSPGLGQGSEFLIYLPLLAEDGHEPMPMDAPNDSPGGHHRLLVIDDNADALLTLSLLLKLKGYEVHSRQSGQEGLLAAQTLRPTVILCDIGMPQMDGYETARLIRQQPWGGPVTLIALSGYGQPEDKQQAKQAGFDAYLVKPVDLAALTQLLDELPLPSHD